MTIPRGRHRLPRHGQLTGRFDFRGTYWRRPVPYDAWFQLAAGGLAQLRRGTLELCLLALLRSGSTYGFDLARQLSDISGLATTDGTVYPVLSRLRRDGLVSTHWQPSDEGPPRRYYSITESGQNALVGFAKEWSRFRASIDAVLEMGENLR